MDRKRAFILSEDAELAVQLVRLLDQHGVTAFWVTQEEGEEPAKLWQVDAWITEQQAHRSEGD